MIKTQWPKKKNEKKRVTSLLFTLNAHRTMSIIFKYSNKIKISNHLKYLQFASLYLYIFHLKNSIWKIVSFSEIIRILWVKSSRLNPETPRVGACVQTPIYAETLLLKRLSFLFKKLISRKTYSFSLHFVVVN